MKNDESKAVATPPNEPKEKQPVVNKNGDKLTGEHFWECFNTHAFDIYEGADQQIRYAGHLLKSITPDALNVARAHDLIQPKEPSQNDDVDLSSIRALPAKRGESIKRGLLSVGIAPEAADVLTRFFCFSLLVAQAEAAQKRWEPYHWHFLGEDSALDLDDAASMADCRRRLVAMFDEDDRTTGANWKASGLTLDDLFEDETGDSGT